jgi:hypothetical protein
MKRNLLIVGLFLAVFFLVCPAFAANLYVCKGGACAFKTIQAAVDAASPGDTIMVGPGGWYGATVNKNVQIKGTFGTFINNGPNTNSPPDTTMATRGFYLVAGSDGATISNFWFMQPLAWGVVGFQANNVTVTLCTFTQLGVGIFIVDGSGWTVTHNQINDPVWFSTNTGTNGGGGIVLATRLATETCAGNVIADNIIQGAWDVLNDSNGNPILTPQAPGVAAYGIGLVITPLDGGTFQTPGYAIANNLFLSNLIDIALATRWANSSHPPTIRAFVFRNLLTNANSTDPVYLASIFPHHGNMIAGNQMPGFTNDTCAGLPCNMHALNTNLTGSAMAAMFSQNGFIPYNPNAWPIW